MSGKTARGKTYSTNVLMSTLGISRGTLRYYEQIGILDPERVPGSNYRTYSNMDVFRVVRSILLRNSGVGLQEAVEVLNGEGVLEHGCVDLCVERAQLQRRRAEAVCERLEALRRAVACAGVDEPRLVKAPTWLMFYDGAEKGYDNFAEDDAQDSLMGSMPLSSFAAVMDIDVFDPGEERATRWGRAVMLPYADLVPELRASSNEPAELGGCPCVTLTYAADQDKIPGFDPTGAVCARIADFVAAKGLEPAGVLFAPDVLPVGDRVYCNLYLPVVARSARGRLALRGLRGA